MADILNTLMMMMLIPILMPLIQTFTTDPEGIGDTTTTLSLVIGGTVTGGAIGSLVSFPLGTILGGGIGALVGGILSLFQ